MCYPQLKGNRDAKNSVYLFYLLLIFFMFNSIVFSHTLCFIHLNRLKPIYLLNITNLVHFGRSGRSEYLEFPTRHVKMPAHGLANAKKSSHSFISVISKKNRQTLYGFIRILDWHKKAR